MPGQCFHHNLGLPGLCFRNTFAPGKTKVQLTNSKDMKKFFTTVAAAAAIAMALPACDKNENNEDPAVKTAEAVAGTYEGTFEMSVMGASQGASNIGCTITAATDNTVNIVLDEVTGMGSMKIVLKADGVTVSETADGYSLSGDIDTTSGETRISGTVSGTIAGDKSSASLTFEFTPGAMPMSITGIFTYPAGDEPSEGGTTENGGNASGSENSEA